MSLAKRLLAQLKDGRRKHRMVGGEQCVIVPSAPGSPSSYVIEDLDGVVFSNGFNTETFSAYIGDMLLGRRFRFERTAVGAIRKAAGL